MTLKIAPKEILEDAVGVHHEGTSTPPQDTRSRPVLILTGGSGGVGFARLQIQQGDRESQRKRR